MSGKNSNHILHSLSPLVSRPLQWGGRLVYWLGWPGIHVILTGSERTRLLVLSGGNCLVVKPYLGSGKWKLPGGGVHSSETPAMTAARELLEETGVQITPERFEQLGTAGITEDGHHYRAHVLAVRLEDTPVLTLRRWEIAEACWLPFENMLEILGAADLCQAARVWAGQ